MERTRKIILLTIGILAVLGLLFAYVGIPMMKKNTKKHSPERTATITQNDLTIDVLYSSPAKKGRDIFGTLVPYDQVWRTGANEATTFTTSKDLIIDTETLPAGKYTLWTIPRQTEWEIIFNDKMYSWGVNFSSEPAREAEYDVLTMTAPVGHRNMEMEDFTISFQEAETGHILMTLSWDTVMVPVILKAK